MSGKLLFYKSEDLHEWKYVNQATTDEKIGWMWECPDYFETDGAQVLIFSPMGITEDGKKDKDQAVCTCVKFEEKTCSMEIPDSFQFLDYGLDLYAPQSTLDEEGRRMMIAWLRMPELEEDTWNGQNSL